MICGAFPECCGVSELQAERGAPPGKLLTVWTAATNTTADTKTYIKQKYIQVLAINTDTMVYA